MEFRNKDIISDNISWTVQKGSWTTHFVITFLFLLVFRTFLNPNLAWQCTVLCYNLGTFIFFHWIIGDPFDHDYYNYTFWEQMTEQLSNTPAMVFLGAFPVILFMVCDYNVKWGCLFYPCVISLGLVVVPKLGFMHKQRLFGLRKGMK